MARKKKKKTLKSRNWTAVAAWERTSAGNMGDKKKYNRKRKHKGKGDS